VVLQHNVSSLCLDDAGYAGVSAYWIKDVEARTAMWQVLKFGSKCNLTGVNAYAAILRIG
jgi:hypothetical protein